MQIYWVIAIVLLIAAAAITALTMGGRKPQAQQATLFKDFKFPTPDEGTPQAVIFGDCWTNDWQVLWVGNYRTEEVHNTGGAGGKKG